ncbi:HNH endonuclease family protein [Carbonactinospora thermoautotrophica]|uniref:HNH endonuclease family protein n=1 Tax=Carbonactinospora thermoautotrophica TaxID=1469144 RepID=UPI0008354150|nr:HNH endonuclease family protein [Carbonactinospora thermoautotrophica]
MVRGNGRPLVLVVLALLVLLLSVLLAVRVLVEEPTARPDEALAQLRELPVRPPASMRGYSRARFPHWIDQGDQCDTRDVVLRRDGQGVRTDSRCEPVAGRWYSPYDDRWLTDDRDVDIDHVVPLANAWRSGANRWTDEQRERFANDLDRPELIVSSATSNRAKGDQSPDQWRPPNRAYWCEYARDWIQVKHYWRLSVTEPEKRALEEMLGTCEPTGTRPGGWRPE